MNEARTKIGQPLMRKDLSNKATGKVKYVADAITIGTLHAKLVTSTEAHAILTNIDTTEAWKVEGVRAIITGKSFPFHIGPLLADRPPLAFEKVRYYGEPIAIVVADEAYQGELAASKVKVTYESLPVINSVQEAFVKDAPLVHKDASQYEKIISDVYPVPGTNIASHNKIRKGDFAKVWAECADTIHANYSFNISDHAALETRCAEVEITANGKVFVHSCTQSPFTIKKVLNQFFNIKVGDIIVHVPEVGGAFGGKGTIQLEPLAYLASNAVGGKKVKLQYNRQEDLTTAPCHIGMDAEIKLGVSKEGKLLAAQYTYWVDSGAYTDQAAGITRAMAVDCSGPYEIPNIWCDAYCMYTNHPYTTSLRGYGHPELTFAVERTMDQMAKKLKMDPIQFRLMNAIKAGGTTPTQTLLTANTVGDASKCLEKVKTLIEWDATTANKGISLFWKTSSTATNAQASVILTFEADGSVNLNCAAVELGQGTKTVLAQIVAEKLGIELNDVHVKMEVNTEHDPHQWRTVASSTTFLAGRAALLAAEDAILQLKKTAAIALQCSEDDLAVGGGKVYLKAKAQYYVTLQEVALGYSFPNGHTVGGQVVGVGTYTQRHLTPLDKETGFGNPGPWWSVGAQAIEVRYDEQNCTYEVIKAVTVLDGGTIINRQSAIQQMRGGMYMGLSLASSETFVFDDSGIVLNPDLRNYQMLRFGEQPKTYLVDFVETPAIDGPYGARGIGEYGVIGMSSALANALSNVARVELNELPLIPERIWEMKWGQKR